METNKPVSRARCQAATKSGNACMGPKVNDSGLCIQHDPARASEWSAEAARRGKAGRAKQTVTDEKIKRRRVSLRCTVDLLSELERLLLEVENSAGDIVPRANCTTSILKTADAILKSGSIEGENRELKKILLDRFPELRSHLKVV